MIPAPFEYERATSVENALELLAQGGEDARVLAGGHSLLPLMRLRLARPTLLVDIGRVDGLGQISVTDESIEIGTLVSHHQLSTSPEVASGCPLLSDTAGQIGDPQVRHRGTVGGSVAHADPASDLLAALLALDATMVIHGPDGSRDVAAADFFHGPFMSAIGAGEMLTAIRVSNDGRRGAYQKFQRRAQDWAIVGVAAVIDGDDGAITSAGIGLTNMGGTPLRATAVEAALVGASDAASVAEASALVSEVGTPPADDQASPEYRTHLASVLIRRAVAEALA